MPQNVIPIITLSDPGMSQDSSDYSGIGYLDGQWVRFYDNRPKKIGGYKLVDWGNTERIRSLYSVEKQGNVDVYLGRPSTLIVNTLTEDGTSSRSIDRTPAGFVANDNNIWDFDGLSTDAFGSFQEYILATACPNYGNDINNNTPGKIYIGRVDQTAPLTELGIETDGGIVVVGNNFLFVFGTNLITWSAPGDPTTPFPTANTYPTSVKIVQGLTVRGGSVPSALFWTLNNLIRATFNPNGTGDADFNFDIVAENITILSPRSVVFANGEYFWIGVDSFYRYNGVAEKIENPFSTSFFFDNVNYSQKAKIHGMYHNFYSEIWWFYPSQFSDECDKVVILNYKTKIFFNLNLSRSASLSPSTQFAYPLMADSNSVINLGNPPAPGTLPDRVYPLWMHEYGVDEYYPQAINAIFTFIETSLFCLKKSAPNVGDKMMKVVKFEPDFSQASGEMEIQFGLRQSPQSTPTYTAPGKYKFDPSTDVIAVHEQGGMVSTRFISNVLGGDFFFGEPTMYVIPGDERLRY